MSFESLPVNGVFTARHTQFAIIVNRITYSNGLRGKAHYMTSYSE